MYNKYHPNKNWKMLISTLKTSVNNSFYESFDITFMGNEKNCQNINCFFFPIIFFLTGLLTNTLRTLISMIHKKLFK